MRERAALVLALMTVGVACGRSGTPAPATPPPAVAPVADPLSRLVSEKAQEAAQRRRAERLGVVADAAAPPRPASSAFAIPTCSRVAAADFDAAGEAQLVCWDDGRLSFWSQGDEGLHQVFHDPVNETVQPGEPQRFLPVDLDGDRRQELLIAWGASRSAQAVPITLEVLAITRDEGGHHQSREVVYRAESQRADIAGLGVADASAGARPDLLLAHFDSKYFVSLKRLRRVEGRWQPTEVMRRRMATSWAFADLDRDGRQEVAVGRPYGEGKLDPGDLVVARGDALTPVPTVLGVRGVAVADLDGDRQPELLFGDGWHYRYGEEAKARLSAAHRASSGAWQSELIEDVPGQIEIAQIEPVDLDGDGQVEIVAAGDKEIRLWRRAGAGWRSTRLADGRQFVVAELRPGERFLVVAGAPIQILPLTLTPSPAVPPPQP